MKSRRIPIAVTIKGIHSVFQVSGFRPQAIDQRSSTQEKIRENIENS
jgi:hypothetical protein